MLSLPHNCIKRDHIPENPPGKLVHAYMRPKQPRRQVPEKNEILPQAGDTNIIHTELNIDNSA